MTGSTCPILRAALVALVLGLAWSSTARAEAAFGSPAWVLEQEAKRRAATGSPEAAPPASGPDAAAASSGEKAAGRPPQIEVAAPGPAEATASGAPAPGAITINPLSRMALDELKAFEGRPLFAPSRRPPFTAPVVVEAPPPGPPPVAEGPAPELRLIGIVAGIDKAVAILGRATGEPPLSVRVGDTVETWRVHVIGPDRVVLRQGESEQIYRIFATAGAAVREAPAMRKPSAAIPSLPSGRPASTAEVQ